MDMRDETAIDTAIASVHEVQTAFSRLKEDLSAEPESEALRQWIEAIESAEALAKDLSELLSMTP
jgi:hypothetical protein